MPVISKLILTKSCLAFVLNYDSVECAQPPVVLRIFTMSKITDNIDEALVKFKEDPPFFLGNDTKKL